MEGLTEGRMVHYVMPDGGHRPAIVVKVWSNDIGCCNLTVFPDWTNDQIQYLRNADGKQEILTEVKNGLMWRTSVVWSPEPEIGKWHWIEKA